MKETIILTGAVNGAEFMRTLARFGVDQLGVRIMGGVQLAQLALARSGQAVTTPCLTSRETPAFLYSFLPAIPYFAAASYADAEQVAAALSSLRRQIPADEAETIRTGLAQGKFPEKNQALITVYEQYMAALETEGKTDPISLMRRAMEESGPLGNDTELLTIKEFPVSPLERKLLEHVSGGRFREISLTELFGKSEAAPIRGFSVARAYGAVNEAEFILSEILRQNFPLDTCVVACSGDRYNRLFFDLCGRYGIPATFGNGVPILSTNPGKLLKSILDWLTTGYHGIDALRNLIGSDALDRKALRELTGLEARDTDMFVSLCGSLRLSFDEEENAKRLADCRAALQEKQDGFQGGGADRDRQELENMIRVCDPAERFAALLAEGIVSFVQQLTYIRKLPVEAGMQDRAALSVMTESLSAYLSNVDGGKPEDVIPDILNKTVGSESSRAGHLHISSISGACAALRQHLFVCGLSADEFPGSPRENYLLLDSDWEAFASDADPFKALPTSSERIGEKKRQLQTLLELACTMGIEPKLSFTDYDTAALKQQNPSPFLLEMFADAYGGDAEEFNKAIRSVSYFDAALSDSRAVGKAHAEGQKILPLQAPVFQTELSAERLKELLDKAWSPTSLETFFNCPRHFYLKEVCRLPEAESDDPFTVLSAATIGKLMHALMERLAEERPEKTEFLQEAEDVFERELKLRPPIRRDEADREKQRFLEMMANAFDMEPVSVNVVSSEERYVGTHPSGIRVNGFPDRVEQLPDGSLVVVDFKSGRKLKHEENDPHTCLQIIVYLWLCETAGGMKMSYGEYRYPRLRETVRCQYDAQIRDALAEKLTVFKDALENSRFERNPGKNEENCRYCGFKEYCGCAAEQEDSGDDE